MIRNHIPDCIFKKYCRKQLSLLDTRTIDFKSRRQCLTKFKFNLNTATRIYNTDVFNRSIAVVILSSDVTFSYFFSSEATGNCLYSSISLLLVGDNRLVEDLRIATSLELYLHPKFYCKQPSLVSCFKEHSGKMFHSFKNLLCMAMTFNAFDDQNHSLCDVELVHVFLVIYCVICMC